MNKENVARWVDELEFGDHKQVFYILHRYEEEGVTASCALGVADLLICSTELNQLKERLSLCGSMVEEGAYMRLPVVHWLDLTDAEVNEIIDLNDRKYYTLPQIGAWVRDNWLKEE